ncbi:MAG: COX15/CtaA family protein [Rhodospirillales bacterium]|nr:COX15/CtaA family protein [Rhodospirillales bacterium]
MTTCRTAATDRWIARWLLMIAAMIFIMIVLGGLTRLTNSGLSMVEWRPVTGWLPPLSEAQWQAAFDAYRQYPEYQKINRGMSLADFQEIFWLEYVHRVWGRLLGIAFLLPMLYVLARRWVDQRLGLTLMGLFVLGGLQGALGWYMVQSGLVDRPDVSQYRLAAHLGLAVVIYGAIVWVAFELLLRARAAAGGRQQPATGTAPAVAPPPLAAFAVIALIFVTVIAGAFVAGLDAGFAYNTFPTMDGDWLPPHLFPLRPLYLNVFEDITTVQFTHRLLATVTLAAVLAWVLSLRRAPAPVRGAALLTAGCVAGQYTLGVLTVVHVVPIPVAALHQAGALVLWTAVLWTMVNLLQARRAPRSAAALAQRALAGV